MSDDDIELQRLDFLEAENNGQQRLPLPGDKGSVFDQLSDKKPEDIFAFFREEFDKLARDYEQFLNDKGVRIFPIKTINDKESVQADFGAPSIGLEFFKTVLKPERAFIYEPVESIYGALKTHTPQAREIGLSLKEQGYPFFENEDEENYPSLIHFANGGVTRAFSDVIDNIVKEFERHQKVRKKYDMEQSGVILVPVPTYGLFLYHMEQATAGKNIEIVPVHRRDNGSVDRRSLRQKIQLCQEEGKRIIGFYDCNPNNPTGYIREKEETEILGEIIYNASSWQVEKDLEQYAKIIKADPEGTQDLQLSVHYIADKPQGQIVIMDDMAYEGLELIEAKKPYSFAQVSQVLAQNTVTFKGVSKVGIPGARIGMAIGHYEIIEAISNTQLVREFCANSLGVDLLAARYGQSDTHQDFEQHQLRLREAHQEKYNFVKVFFRGLDNVEELTEIQRHKLITLYSRYAEISEEESEKRLKRGLPNFSIPDELECGFFLPIYCEALRDKRITVQVADDNQDMIKMPQSRWIDHGDMVYWTFKSFGIKTIPSSWQGMPERSMMARMTLSMPEEDFYKFYDRMTEMHEYFWGEDPEVLPDLFREESRKAAFAPKMA